jgi:hypothetical protein
MARQRGPWRMLVALSVSPRLWPLIMRGLHPGMLVRLRLGGCGPVLAGRCGLSLPEMLLLAVWMTKPQK